jgi:hypothetical protein
VVEAQCNERARRIALYGAALVAFVGLGYGGFVWNPEAEVGTLLGAVDSQLRFAAAMPTHDKDGQELSTRKTLLDSSREMLERVERQSPRDPIAWEYKAYLAWLEGDAAASAQIYGTARTFADCTAELQRCFLLNEARMWATAGDRARAVAVLRSESNVSGVDAGLLFEELGERESAQRAFDAVAASDVRATYFTGRLKLRIGDTDTAVAAVESALARDSGKTRELLREDAGLWRSRVEAERLTRWLGTEAATPPNGR